MPIYGEKYPRPMLMRKSVGAYGIRAYFLRSCLIVTAIASPTKINNRARASPETNPLIMFIFIPFCYLTFYKQNKYQILFQTISLNYSR